LYQVALENFSNFGQIQLDPPLDVKAILDLAIKSKKNMPEWCSELSVEELETVQSIFV
jgi:hypothetical protein